MPQYIFRQIRTDPNLYLMIKMFCVQNGITLFQFFDNVLRAFLRSIKHKKVIFQPSFRHGKLLSVRINQLHAINIKKLAVEDHVSESSVIYTALIHYIDANPLK